jgi:hypothetical protein
MLASRGQGHPRGMTRRSSSCGGRGSAHTSSRRDVALGRLPDDDRGRRFAEEQAARLAALLAGRTMTYGEAGRGLGVHPNSLRYAAPTGTVLIRWEGARQPTIWTVPAPEVDPLDARLELARRYLHVFGPRRPMRSLSGRASRRREAARRLMRSADR